MKKIKPVINTIATSHLDTSWNWTLEKTLDEFLPKTFIDNFELLKKYPEYNFSFEGSYRYELCEEYYPELFSQLKEYVRLGRWHVSGSAYENGDTNIPSPEALFRNFLYGNRYFYEKFGKKSLDVFLPDCFGFGYALPSVARHAGLSGFTTQKLTWSSFAGVPFDLGKWYGVDGEFIYALFDASGYQRNYKKSVRLSYVAPAKLRSNLKKYYLPYTAILYGTGDRGGAPKEESVKTVCREIAENPGSAVDVVSAPSDKVFKDLALLDSARKNMLPTYKGELVSTDHGAGGYTSRTASKRLNRRCEQLGEMAERASVFSLLLGAGEYNKNTLDTAWKRVIAHQFHDDITGTSLMDCYKRNWNDYFLSLNQFGEEYRAACADISAKLDTSFAKGTPICVVNSLQYERTEVVTIFAENGENSVYGSDGKQLPVSIGEKDGRRTLSFLADVLPLGAASFDVRKTKATALSQLKVTENLLENEYLKATLDENGDVCSIYNKLLKREVLKAPIRFALFDYIGSLAWPAWEMSYKDLCAGASEYPSLISTAITENGSARVTLKVKKRARGSDFITYISLDAKSEYIAFYNEIDWRSENTLLKTEFSFMSEGDALYDLGLGVIKRPDNTPERFEVPAQMWAAIPDSSGSFTTAVLSDSRVGWDKPDRSTLRLTCMHSPKWQYREASAQHLLDFGINRFSFAVYANDGSVAEIQKNALCFNQPLCAEISALHKTNETSLSFGKLSSDGVILRAFKLAEDSDGYIVRFNECEGRERADISFSLLAGITAAEECDGGENVIGSACVKDGALVFSIKPFGVKTFKLHTKAVKSESKKALKQLKLPFDFCCTTGNNARASSTELSGYTLPAEQYGNILCGNIKFDLSSDEPNALVCRSQKIKVPRDAKTLYILASSVGGDKKCEFTLDGKGVDVFVLDMYDNIGAWDLYALEETGYVKRSVVARQFTHTHTNDSDCRGKNAYIFRIAIDCDGIKEIALPSDADVIVFGAVTSAEKYLPTVSEIYDSLEKRECTFKVTEELTARHQKTKSEGRKGQLKFGSSYAKRQLQREIKMRF